MTADFLNNPQWNSSVAHLGERSSPKTMGGGSLDVGPLERFSQNLVRARRGANADSGGSGGGRGINKSDPRWVSKMSRDFANLRLPESFGFGVGLWCCPCGS